MLKSDIVQRLKELHPEFTKEDLSDVVDIIFSSMKEALFSGRRIEIRGLGSFSLRPQRGKVFKNPKTGKVTNCKDSLRIVFRPGKDLKNKF